MKRGVEDRWKILNIFMLMTFAKDVAPYLLMYNSAMLPSTFSSRFYRGSNEEDAALVPSYIDELVGGCAATTLL